METQKKEFCSVKIGLIPACSLDDHLVLQPPDVKTSQNMIFFNLQMLEQAKILFF